MIPKIVFVTVIIEMVNSQRLITPVNFPSILNELLDRRHQPIPALTPAESDIICKNFGTSIQNVMLENFANNCLQKPIFGQISAPLVNDIATNVCKCPSCSAVTISPNSYSNTFITPATVSSIINSGNGYNKIANNVFSNVANNVVTNVPVNNGPLNFVVPNNANYINNAKPVNNLKISDILSLLKGLECSCKVPVVV